MKKRQLIGNVNLDALEFAKVQALRRGIPMGAFLTLVLKEWGYDRDMEGANLINLQEPAHAYRDSES